MYKTKSRHRNINMKSTINTISTITISDFISSTPICSLKLSSQSKWWHPTANAPKNYVSTLIYRTTNVPYP